MAIHDINDPPQQYSGFTSADLKELLNLSSFMYLKKNKPPEGHISQSWQPKEQNGDKRTMEYHITCWETKINIYYLIDYKPMHFSKIPIRSLLFDRVETYRINLG